MNIHHDLEKIKLVAMDLAKRHSCNYNIIVLNLNDKGEFDLEARSTYEFVLDSYFDKPRPNAILIHKTDDLLINETSK